MALNAVRIAYTILLKLGRQLTRSRRWWVLLATPLVAVVGIFFACQNYSSLWRSEGWDAYLEKSRDPLRNMADYHHPDTHASKLTFRLTVPVVAHVLGLGKLGLFVWMHLASIILIIGALVLVWRDTGDRVTALGAALYLVGTNAGMMGFTPYFPYIDGIYLSIIMLAMVFRNPFGIALMCFAAAWCDERSLATTSMVMVYHGYRWWLAREERGKGVGDLLKQALAFLVSPSSLAIMASWVAYVVVRLYLAKFHGMETVSEGLTLLERAKHGFHLSLWTALEAGWVVLTLGVVALCLRREWVFAAAVLTTTALICAISFLVRDVSKSMAYAFPLFFIAMLVLGQTERVSSLRRLVFGVALASLAMGNYVIWTGSDKDMFFWVYPLFMYLQ